MRAITLIVLATLLVPIHVAGQNAPVPALVPPVGAGARANYTLTYGSPAGVIDEWRQAHSWSAMENYEDGFGTLRPSYVVTVASECDPRYPCGPTRLRVDPATGVVFEIRALYGLVLSFGAAVIGPVETERYWDFVSDARIFDHLAVPPWLAHGRTLVPGETIVVDVPVSAAEPASKGNATLSVIDWENVGGRALLRVDAEVASTIYPLRRTTLWFDGIHPLPVEMHTDLSFTSCNESGCTRHERWLRTVLTSYEIGGEPLTTSAPAFREDRQDVLRAALGRDGPDDLDLASFPRADAIARVRADPVASAWFAERPDAYLVSGWARERTDFDQAAHWELRWAQGAEYLDAQIERPAVLGVSVPVDQLELSMDTARLAYPAFRELPRQDIACVEQAKADTHARIGRVDHARPDRSVGFAISWRYGLLDAYCSYRESEPVATPAVEEHGDAVVAVTQRARSISAGVLGWNGALVGAADGDYGAVDPIWLHQDDLALRRPAQG